MPADLDVQSRTAEIEIVLQHYRAICEEHDNVDDAKALEKSLIAKAAASGVHVKALKLAHKVVKMGPREGKTYLEAAMRYVDAISGGMMQQEEMFRDSSEISEKARAEQLEWLNNRGAEEAGYAAGKNGEPIGNNAHQPGTAQHVRWASGWADGHEDFVAARGSEIHPKKDSKRPEDRTEDEGENSQ